MSEFVGGILAAGRGRRMGILADYYPKPLLPVANEPLIFHHLRMLHSLGVRKVFVVTGYRAVDIVRILESGEQFDLELIYVEQNASLGSAHALGQLAPYVDQPLVLFLGDYFVSAPELPAMVTRALETNGSVMAAKLESDHQALREACTLDVDAEGRILQIVEKPKVILNNLKGCGIYIFQPEFFDAVRRTPRTALRDEYELSISIDLYIKSGYPMYAEKVIEWDRNFTRPEDVLYCNLEWLAQHDQSELVGQNAYIAPGTQIERTVIGDNVVITEPATFKDSVIFSDVKIESRRETWHTLITPILSLPCSDDR